MHASSILTIIWNRRKGGGTTERNRQVWEHDAVFFDAALPARQHRQRLLVLAQAKGVPVIAVFVQASLEQALARNALRTPDKVVPEVALRSVFTLLEPPRVEEGFASVVLVAAQA